MDLMSIILVILGLALFETVSSVDNAIINAQVLSTMGRQGRRWFLLWGLLVAVFVVRGLLPWMLVWALTPSLGPLQALSAAFSGDPAVKEAVTSSSPILLVGGGTFLLFLFFYWLFLEPKEFGIKGERFIYSKGPWFYALVSLLLAVIVWLCLQDNPMMAFGAVLGSTAFFITHGFKENAAEAERRMEKDEGVISDMSKVFYLMVIDATFSLDGVLGAFAFTLSVPLILLGNGLGAVIVRQLTVSNVDRIKKYSFLKNGAMYSILGLGLIMLMDAFGFAIPVFISPLLTALIVGYFFIKSTRKKNH